MLKRYFATADNTITNAFEENLTTRGTGSNMGAADILEVFSIYGQASSTSAEESRALLRFDTTGSVKSIRVDRVAGKIPASGSVSFHLCMFNASHGQTLPKSYTMNVAAVTEEWTEGTGLDMEGYKDKDDSNWINRIDSTAWTTAGGQYAVDASSSFTAEFDDGTEDIEVDITELVEQWLNSTGNVLGNKDDFGLGVMISSAYSAAQRSYYTKKFFGRDTEFHFMKPVIEARWDSSLKDERGVFYWATPLQTAAENTNTIYFYNYHRGRLRDIPTVGTGEVYVSLYSGSAAGVPEGSAINLNINGSTVLAPAPTVVTGGWVSSGIYSASFGLNEQTLENTGLYDVWSTSTGTEFHTGSISPSKATGTHIAPETTYVSNITNLKSTYQTDEIARLRVFTRQKDWCPTIYTKATSNVEVNIVESGAYEIYRVIDDLKVVPYGTGSSLHTQMSFDASGSYFDLDMEMLESGYMYGIKLAYYNNSIESWVEQPETFKFRVESRQNR